MNKKIILIMMLLVLLLAVGCKNPLKEIEQLSPREIYAAYFDELVVDYDKYSDEYDCFLIRENKHVYISGEDIITRPYWDNEVVLYDLGNDKYILVFYIDFSVDIGD